MASGNKDIAEYGKSTQFASGYEAVKNGKKGGAASVKSKRKKKSIAETANMVLNSTVTDPKQLAAIEKAGLPIPDKPTYKDFIVASIMLRTVQKGRIDDLEKLMDILGEPLGGESVEDKEIVRIELTRNGRPI